MRRKKKNIFSLLLTLVLISSLGITSLAATTASPTVIETATTEIATATPTKEGLLEPVDLPITTYVPQMFNRRSVAIEKSTVERSTTLTEDDALTSYTKSAVRTNGCRTYEVTLGLDGVPPIKPLDVVLVIDRSGSMGSGDNSPMYFAKKAAIDFSDKVLKANPENKVAIVSFNGPSEFGQIGSDANASLNMNFTSKIQDIIASVNSISAGGGTNIQAAFDVASNTMKNSSRQSTIKSIILLTDGVATASNVDEAGPNDPTNHNKHTTAAYNAGINSQKYGAIYTVGLLRDVSDTNGSPYSTRFVARDTLVKAQNSGYYETLAAADLGEIYSKIYKNLGFYANNAVVVDKIGDNFNLIEDSLPSGAIYNKITREITWSPGTLSKATELKYVVQAKPDFPGGLAYTNEYANLSYEDAATGHKELQFERPQVNVPKRLSVSLSNVTSDIGTSVSLGDSGYPNGQNVMSEITGGDGNGTYTYLWSEVNSKTVISTEKNPKVNPDVDTQYQVIITDSNGCKATAKMWVRPRGKITVTKIVKNIQDKDKDRKFDIWIFGSDGKVWTVSLKNGESQTITGLIAGQYTVSETPPMNFTLLGIEGANSSISLESPSPSVKVTNERSNNSWFYDDDEETNEFDTESILIK